MGAFTPFCLYLAARVFVLALKDVPFEQSEHLRSNLQFLITKLQLLRPVIKFTESLLLQLDLDLDTLDDLNPTGHIITSPLAVMMRMVV